MLFIAVDDILMYFFFRQKLKHKLQWQLLMPILTWTIPTKNTKNARNKFWAKEWKIRCTSTTTWTNLKFLIPVLWSKDGFLKFQSLASRDYPTGDNNCGRFTDQLPTCSCPRSYWMPPLIIFFGEAFSFHTEFSTDFVTCRIYIKLMPMTSVYVSSLQMYSWWVSNIFFIIILDSLFHIRFFEYWPLKFARSSEFKSSFNS